VRWFSTPQLFRYERQQKGRLREHFQLNVDMVGEADVTADAELLACAIDIMRAFGLTSDDVVVRVSDRRVLRGYLLSLGIPDHSVNDVYIVIDKLQRQPASVSSEKLLALGLSQQAIDAILSIGTTTIEAVRVAIANSEVVSVDTGRAIENFTRYLRYVSALVPEGAAWIQFDLSIVRGLAYYTGIVFELFDRRGEFRAICGGGRYDTLLANLGDVDLPALGFGMGDVVLSELLRARGLMPPVVPSVDYWIVTDDDVQTERAMHEAAQLRAAGHSVEFSLRPQTLSKQLKAAKSAGARETITIK
jgi:histidyl-tRNA synthetase